MPTRTNTNYHNRAPPIHFNPNRSLGFMAEWPKLRRDGDVDKMPKGILSYYDKTISTAMVEGINNKIKTLKRMAYGFRDNDYFNIRLLALHDYKVA